VVHRRSSFGPRDVTRQRGIPVTTPACTIVDIATTDSEKQLERAINDADQLGLIRFDVLRAAVELMPLRRPGVATVHELIHRHTFRLTRSELERLFLPIAKRAGLPVPETRAIVNGFEVDFYWPELGLVVETDSLRYHRTPSTQTGDVRRDQTHFASGLIPLRFTHWQVAKEPRYVQKMLVAARRHLPAPAAKRAA
jgi:very-short-patch-repair endonuclease